MKPPDKKNKAKQLILDYLAELHRQMLAGIPISSTDYDRCRTRDSIAEYIFSGVTYLPDKNGNYTIPEFSERTVYDAVDELKKDGLIEKDEIFKLVPDEDEFLKKFPILNCASKINITQMPVDSMIFFHVNENYAKELTDFINSFFHPQDVHAVCMGDLIMCVDIAPPANSPIVKKKNSLEKRVLKKLRLFNVEQSTYYDLKKGYDSHELYQQHLKQQEKEFNAMVTETTEETPSGGKITDPPKRKFKKNKI